MNNKNTVSVRGKVIEYVMIEALPCSADNLEAVVKEITVIEGWFNGQLNAMMIGNSVMSLIVGDRLYIPTDIATHQKAKDELLLRSADHFFPDMENAIRTPESITKPFNQRYNVTGEIQDKILAEGFVIQSVAHPDEDNDLASISTVGLWHDDLPELIIFGGFKHDTNVGHFVLSEIFSYIREHGFEARVYECGEIFENQRVEIRSLDESQNGLEHLLGVTSEYWQTTVPIAQVILSDDSNRLPRDEGYNQQDFPQVILKERILHA